MRWSVGLLAAGLLLSGCGKPDRSIDAEIDADFAKGELLLSCRTSGSGTCHAVFLADGQAFRAQASAGGTASVSSVGEGTDYCVEASVPDPARCKPTPLVQGKQIVRRLTVKH
ncbi:hypothetical protein [Sphingomonas sp.]|uniref:hypothetical protein n=1 Tax=Sphingomonas sp. TaxID=28214 RepID=UPI001B1C7392|nr:hypothetical protein [Sphingomonas sp.]MBO9713421.1 hypothetical protein [Sphingomonas sp.]